MVEASVRVVAPAAQRTEVLDVLRSLKGPAESTPGCLQCCILQDAEDENLLMYVVRWETQEELEAHMRSERFRRLLPYIEMSVEAPEVDVSNVERVGGIEFLVSVLDANGPTKR
ncbi:MAG: putative quinol monooxygenase [Maioricimonas sp. JB045]